MVEILLRVSKDGVPVPSKVPAGLIQSRTRSPRKQGRYRFQVENGISISGSVCHARSQHGTANVLEFSAGNQSTAQSISESELASPGSLSVSSSL